jgi:catechol 2,3-dioxygenase-like lactoylglutathione lyase family enzyme
VISHIHIGINDFSRAFVFYEAIMRELGLLLKFSEPDNAWAGWVSANAPRPLFLIGKPQNGEPASVGNGQMIALLSPDRNTVDRVHALALQLGGRCEGKPGLRPHYHPDYYGAYFRDPEGNKICICYHDPA